MKQHTRHHYKNIFLIFVAILAALLLSRSGELGYLGNLGYVGIFVAGALLVSTFTAPAAIVILLILAKQYPPLMIGLIAGGGAVLSDALIFHFVKDGLSDELTDVYKRFGGSHVTHILHSKHFRWTMPVVGALIIASPLPDELGVTLMGISKMTLLRFVIASFIMHSVGIFLIVSGASLLPLLQN